MSSYRKRGVVSSNHWFTLLFLCRLRDSLSKWYQDDFQWIMIQPSDNFFMNTSKVENQAFMVIDKTHWGKWCISWFIHCLSKTAAYVKRKFEVKRATESWQCARQDSVNSREKWMLWRLVQPQNFGALQAYNSDVLVLHSKQTNK